MTHFFVTDEIWKATEKQVKWVIIYLLVYAYVSDQHGLKAAWLNFKQVFSWL